MHQFGNCFGLPDCLEVGRCLPTRSPHSRKLDKLQIKIERQTEFYSRTPTKMKYTKIIMFSEYWYGTFFQNHKGTGSFFFVVSFFDVNVWQRGNTGKGEKQTISVKPQYCTVYSTIRTLYIKTTKRMPPYLGYIHVYVSPNKWHPFMPLY